MRRTNAQVDAERLRSGEPTLDEIFLGEPNRHSFLSKDVYVVYEETSRETSKVKKSKVNYAFLLTEPSSPTKKQAIYWRRNETKTPIPARGALTVVKGSESFRLVLTCDPIVQKWRATTGLVEGYVEPSL
jgi:hypothetical protein